MYKKNKILALITARGGSKGIPRKNIVQLGDKPLLAWSINAALKSKYIDRLILSSDDEEIMKVAEKYGCEVPFKRPGHLGEDTTSSMDVIMHALNECNGSGEFDYLVLLQPTSPFRTTESIDKCIEYCVENNYPISVSVAKSKKSPVHMYYRGKDNTLEPILGEFVKNTRRQDQKEVYEHNGAIYISEIPFLIEKQTYNCKETRLFEMFGIENLDIDTIEDLKFARNFLSLRS